jgi:hypothetical protein
VESLQAQLDTLIWKWRGRAARAEELGRRASAEVRKECADDLASLLARQEQRLKEEKDQDSQTRVAPSVPCVEGLDLPQSGNEATPSMADAAEMLWVVLANVSGGDWKQQSKDWQDAEARWRDNYFAAVKAERAGSRPSRPAGAREAVSLHEMRREICAGGLVPERSRRGHLCRRDDGSAAHGAQA